MPRFDLDGGCRVWVNAVVPNEHADDIVVALRVEAGKSDVLLGLSEFDAVSLAEALAETRVEV